MTYSQDSLLLDLIARDEEIFLVDVNKKLAEHSPDLLLYWSRVTRTSLLTALSLIREEQITLITPETNLKWSLFI